MKSERIRIADMLEPFEELLGTRPEPELLTLTEKHGFMAQSEKYNKRVARNDTHDYKVIRKHDIAFNPYLLWAGAIAQNIDWEMGLISPLYPTFHIRSGFDPRFVDYLLGGEPLRLLYDTIAFGSVPRKRRTSVSDFLALEVPKPPPLAEQRRIAEVLDQAEALRAKRRAALAELDELTQSIFLDMFGDPATNPKGWPRKSIGSLASKFSDGPFGSNLKSEHYTDTGVRVIRLQNIGVGEFVDENKAFVSECHFTVLKKHECLPGDILIGTLGDPNLRACIQPDWLPIAVNKADCVQLRPNERVANATFVCALLNLPAMEHMSQDLKHGQTRVRINMGRLRELEVPVPPLAFQLEFAGRVATVEKLKAVQRASLVELDELFAALQHRAFRGEL